MIRFRDAPSYLGMDRNRFNTEVRPTLTEVPVGAQGIAFDRLELDAWVDEYVACNGRPGQKKGISTWDVNAHPDSISAMESGTSTNSSEAAEFARALDRATSKKRKSIS